MTFTIELLSSNHDRTAFACGSEPLDRYFRHQVGQDVRRRVIARFVTVDEGNGEIAGYYTLAAGAVLLADLPEAQIKRLPRYPSVPVARLGRDLPPWCGAGIMSVRRVIGPHPLSSYQLSGITSE